MHNILVTGANGQLGNELRNISKYLPDNFIFTDITKVDYAKTITLDITDIKAIRSVALINKVDTIINCAAYTNVDKAETDLVSAHKLNVEAVANLATIAKEIEGLLIHISTDYVFGKEPYNVPCKEDQQGTPTGVYGLTKLHGEQEILKSGCRYIIIRTSWLYSEYGKNFCKTMYNLTKEKSELKVVFDQCGTPTYAKDLASTICTIINKPICGIYNYSNEGVCSWYDFTKMIAEYSNHTECDIQPCHSDEYPSTVIRPSYSVLDKTKIKDTFKIKIPYWTDSLKKCIENIKGLA